MKRAMAVGKQRVKHTQSRPAWARGLKLALCCQKTCLSVAPRVGAWIETNS